MTFSASSLSLLLSLTPQLLGWKELPPEDPLISAYFKVLGQEIAFVDIDKDAIQQIMMVLTRLLMFSLAILNHFPSASPLTYFPNPFLCFQSLTGSSDWQPVVKKVLEEVQRGISGRWTVPVIVAEMRHIVPTIAGLPLELGLCAAVVAQAAADGELGMPNSAAPPQ